MRASTPAGVTLTGMTTNHNQHTLEWVLNTLLDTILDAWDECQDGEDAASETVAYIYGIKCGLNIACKFPNQISGNYTDLFHQLLTNAIDTEPDHIREELLNLQKQHFPTM